MTLECKIPRDRSALGMMAHNAMNHGDDFRHDGYVYDANGIRIRKWFSGLGDHSRNKYFWHPCLKNISKIESLLHRLSTRQVQTWARLEMLFKQIQLQSEPTKRYGSDTWIVHAKLSIKASLYPSAAAMFSLLAQISNFSLGVDMGQRMFAILKEAGAFQ